MLIAILSIGLLYSQKSPPRLIEIDNILGVFISENLMDSISIKLIDRKSLIKERDLLSETIQLSKRHISELQSTISLKDDQIYNYRKISTICKNQNNLLTESIENQKIIISNIKAKARKNGLLYFGGGAAIGLVAFAVFVK